MTVSVDTDDVGVIAGKLTEMEREALALAFEVSKPWGWAPAFSRGSVFALERAGLASPRGAWAILTPLGLAVRDYLLSLDEDK